MDEVLESWELKVATVDIWKVKVDEYSVFSFQNTYDFLTALSIYLSISLSLFVCLSVCLSIYPSICLSVCQSVYPSIYLSVSLSIHLSICLSICLSIHLSIYPPIHLTIYPSIRLSVCLSVYLSIYLSICLSTSNICILALYIWYLHTHTLTWECGLQDLQSILLPDQWSFCKAPLPLENWSLHADWPGKLGSWVDHLRA